MNAEEKYEQALARARELYNAAKVYDFTDDMKRLEYVFPELNEKSSASADEVQYKRGYDDDISLWSIADARDGDVLVSNNYPFIYNGMCEVDTELQ